MLNKNHFIVLVFIGLLFFAASGLIFAQPYCQPDLNGDKFVDFADFVFLADNWMKSGIGLAGDLDDSGTVDVEDVAEFAEKWLQRFVVIYVDSNAAPGGNGSSWESAFIYLQDALDAATSGEQIWVAEGVYKPDANSSNPNGTGLRTSTFQLPEGVAIYGGFPAGSCWEYREPNLYETILSGDIGDEGISGDNCYNVVVGADDITIDGFIIADGYANGPGDNARGGGMHNKYANNIMIANCTFRDNQADCGGGGLYNYRSEVLVTDCVFRGNRINNCWGGGMCNYLSGGRVINCMFEDNYSYFVGGGMCNYYCTVMNVTNCTFKDNHAEDDGGGMYNYFGNYYGNKLILTNCVFKNNTTGDEGGGIYNYESEITANDCTFADNYAYNSGGGIYNSAAELTATNCVFSSNHATNDEGGGIYNYESELKAIDCAFADNYAYYSGGGIYNSEGKLTAINCAFNGNCALYGGGGGICSIVNNIIITSTLINCTIYGNLSNNGSGIYKGVINKVIVTNCVLWGTGESGEEQIGGDTYNLTVNNSCIQDYVPGSWGIGNTGENPQFIDPNDPNGPDDELGTSDDGLTLGPASPCIDAGDGNVVPLDIITDIKGDARFKGTAIDMGAFEFGNLAINQDSDGDGMADWFEYRYGLDPLDPNDAELDGDLDDLTNLGEYQNGTDPTNPDTDGDGMPDGWEVEYGLAPTVDDADGDLDSDDLINLGEYQNGTDPTNSDTDGDGMPDGWEVEYGLDPLFDDADGDLDSDEITNIGEYQGGTNPAVNDADEDLDGDGLTNLEEFILIINVDTDDDLLPDRWELLYGLNPLVSDVIDVNAQGDNIYPDSDGDGLDLMKELIYGTNPALADTDGDGTNDGIEAAQGSLPNDASDNGQAPPPEEICVLKLTVGDDSGSHSERYNLVVGPVPHQARQFGVVRSANYNQFRAGERYEVRIIWKGCNKIGVNCGFPDYDYEAYIEAVSLPAGVVMQIEDAEGILGEHWATFDDVGCTWRDPFYAKGKVAYVNLIKADITYANVTEDKIHINLEPSGLTGTLKLESTGPGASHTIREVVRSSGSYDETFDIPNLAIGEYTKVKATWTVAGQVSTDEYNYHIRVLGNYKHTCYNTPDESGCSGSPQWFSYTIGDCVNTDCAWHEAQGKTGWLDAITNPVYGTGSGKDASGNVYSMEWYCTGNPHSPKLRRTGCACAKCGGCLSVGDVAINSGHEKLSCGDRVYVYQHGTHTVRDHGGGVTVTQLDHYYGVSGCGDCPSLGDSIMTIKLFE